MMLFFVKIFLLVTSLSLFVIGIKLFLLPLLKRKNPWYLKQALNVANNNSKHLEGTEPYNVNYTKGLSFVSKYKKKCAQLFDLNIQSRPHSKGWNY